MIGKHHSKPISYANIPIKLSHSENFPFQQGWEYVLGVDVNNMVLVTNQYCSIKHCTILISIRTDMFS